MLEVFESLQIALVDSIIVGGGVLGQFLHGPELLIEPHELLLLALEFLDLKLKVVLHIHTLVLDTYSTLISVRFLTYCLKLSMSWAWNEMVSASFLILRPKAWRSCSK